MSWETSCEEAWKENNRLCAELVRLEWIDKFSQKVVEENKQLWEIAELAAKESFYQARDASRAILAKTASGQQLVDDRPSTMNNSLKPADDKTDKP